MLKWMKAGLLAGALALGVVAVQDARAQGQPPIKIAAIVPLSGAGAFDGQLALEGMRAEVALINAAGGVIGRQIELVVYDDKGTPEEGVAAAQRAIEQDKVDLIVGGWFSAVALAMKEVTRDKIITIMTSAQHPDVTAKGHRYLFRLNATSSMMSTRYSQEICTRIRPKSVAFITINDDFGRLEVENYTRLLTACGIEVKGNEFYNRNDTDFNVALTKLRALNADAIYVSAINTSQGATIYRQARQAGFRGTLVASAGNMNPKLVELSGRALEGVYSISLYAPDSGNPMLDAWTRQYRSTFQNQPAFIGTLGGQAVRVLASAVQTAGSSRDYDKIAAALRGPTLPTLLGDIKFDETGQALQNLYLVRVQNGDITTVRQ
jgi:branched-chain amino acid transport system substrate-binding protein